MKPLAEQIKVSRHYGYRIKSLYYKSDVLDIFVF